MADRLNQYLMQSLSKWLEDNLTINDALLVGPEFDWDQKPDVTDARRKVPRPVPFIGISSELDHESPFSMCKNILAEREMTFSVVICGTGLTNLYELTADMKQTIGVAEHPITGDIGIPLYDYAVVSGTYYNYAGTVGVEEIDSPIYATISSNDEQSNRRFMSETFIRFSAFKDRTAKLLENMGRIGIND